MAHRGGELSFLKGMHVRTDVIFDIPIFIRPMITDFGKQINLQDLNQMTLIMQVLLTSLCQDHVTN